MNNEPKLLNVGDKITEKSNYRAPVILTVTRVTATQAMCLNAHGNEQKFKREIIGDSIDAVAPPKWPTTFYRVTVPADYAAVERANGLLFLKDYKFGKLSNAQLAQVLDLLKSFQQ